jgi:nucleoside-diphosphate-sugar epimerase
MQIFITGASGFIGGAIAKSLSAAHDIRAMSRAEQSDDAVRGLGAAPVRCEMGSVRPEHLVGCDVVIHCAAFVKQWGTREQFWSANVDGTVQLLDAAKQAGIARFIFISTEAVLFDGHFLRDLDESMPYPVHTPFLYPETKAAAEKLVLAANVPDFTTISLRPRFVWGPGDNTILPVVKKAVKRAMYMWIDGGRAKTVTTHIDNVVHAVTLALTRGRGGQSYFITDDGTTTVREFLTALMKTQGLTMPNASIPGSLARALGAMIDVVWKTLRLKSEPPLTRFAAAMAASDCTIRIDKARAELGYSPVITREQGLAELTSQG